MMVNMEKFRRNCEMSSEKLTRKGKDDDDDAVFCNWKNGNDSPFSVVSNDSSGTLNL